MIINTRKPLTINKIYTPEKSGLESLPEDKSKEQAKPLKIKRKYDKKYRAGTIRMGIQTKESDKYPLIMENGKKV